MVHNSPFNKQSIAVFIAIILLSALSCTPKPPISDKDYIISISLKSSLTDKQIADNTELVLIEKGKSESLKTYTENGLAVFSFEAPENTELNMVLIVSESTGHDGFIYNFTTTGNKSIELSLAAKTFSVPISFTTTSNNIPVGNISYSINIDEITGETDAEGKAIVAFRLNTNEYNEGMNTEASFDFAQSNTTKPMHYDRTIIVKGENNFTFDLTKESYQHAFNVTTSGNIKTPLLTEAIGTITYDNETTSFDPKTGIISFVSDDETENGIKVQVSNVEGYKNGEIIINNIGSRTKNGENYNIELEGLIYDATQPLIVTDGENPISGANVSYTFGEETGTAQTETNGTTSINITNIETDINNLPLDEYILNTTTTKEGYPESTNNFNISTGTNDQITISMGANKYWMTGKVTPEETEVKGWKEGNIIFNTNVSAGKFATDTIQSATDNYTLDSLIFNAEGFITKKFYEVTLNKNEVTTQNTDLEEEITTQTNTINYTTNLTTGTAWLLGPGMTNTSFVAINTDGTANINYNHQSNEPTNNIDIGVRSTGKIPQQKNITVEEENNYNETFALEDITYNYWITGTGTTPTNTTTIKGYLNGEIFTANTSNGTFETNHINKTETTITLDSITFTAPGYTKFKEENFTMNPNGTNKNNITLQEIITEYTTHIQGKVLDLTKQRVTNRTNALIITNATGTEHYFNLDENGEFNGDIITNDPNETVTAHWNENTMSDFDKNTISFNKQNETYPINRVIAGDYKPYDETTRVSVNVSKLDDDYLRVYAGKDIIVDDEILKFAVRGYSNEGSFNYGRTEPLRPYVYTLQPDGTPVTALDIQDMELAVDQARNIFYDTETGWTIPVNERQTGTDIGTRSGGWLMRQIPNTGYWNGGYMITGETNLLEGGEARVDVNVAPNAGYREIIGPWIRDGPSGSNGYCFIQQEEEGKTIYALTDLGKAHMSITTDFPAGSGKE